MPEYIVENALKTKEFSGQYGKTFVYTVQLKGQTDTVELNQKPESPAPKPGDKLSGTIEDTQWGKRFKKDRTTGGFRGGYDSEGQAWGNSVSNATALVAAYSKEVSFANAPDKVIEIATYLFENRDKYKKDAPSQPEQNSDDDNRPPVEVYSNVDEIPF